MRFLDTLLKTAQSRGMEVVLDMKYGKESTFLAIGKTVIHCRFWETCNGMGKDRHARGEFFLTLDARGVSDRDWDEHNNKPLETRIDHILDTAERMAVRVQKWEREWEQRDRESAEKERQRAAAEAIQLKEEMLRSQLTEMIERWQQAERVRAYLAAVKAKAGKVEPITQLGQWLDWAQKHAAALDPLPPSWGSLSRDSKAQKGTPAKTS